MCSERSVVFPDVPARLVVLASGSGTTLQAMIDATRVPDYGVEVVAIGSDRPGIGALARAKGAGIAHFVCRVVDFPDRTAWDLALTERVAALAPDLVLSAGFMKLVGPGFLAAFGGRYVNSHPALLPAFPGMHGARDALDYGVKISGCTLFVVDGGVDSGPIIDQRPVPVAEDDTEETLHERIKLAERDMLVDVIGRMARNGWTVENRRVRIQ